MPLGSIAAAAPLRPVPLRWDPRAGILRSIRDLPGPPEGSLIPRIEAMALSRRGLAQCNLRLYEEAIASLSASRAIFGELGIEDEAARIAEDMREVESKLAAQSREAGGVGGRPAAE